jgi:hypothetical protein
VCECVYIYIAFLLPLCSPPPPDCLPFKDSSEASRLVIFFFGGFFSLFRWCFHMPICGRVGVNPGQDKFFLSGCPFSPSCAWAVRGSLIGKISIFSLSEVFFFCAVWGTLGSLIGKTLGCFFALCIGRVFGKGECLPIYVSMYVCIHAYIYIYVCMYIYIYIFTHTHTHTH